MFKQYSWQFESYELGSTLTSVFIIIQESKLCSKSLSLYSIYLLIVLQGDPFSNCNFSEGKKTPAENFIRIVFDREQKWAKVFNV